MSRRNTVRKQRQRTELAGARACLDYRDRTGAGYCCNFWCIERGRPEFAVWWKCPSGHREEILYCAVHGPEHLDLAVRSGARITCRCGAEWMTPMAEGLPEPEYWPFPFGLGALRHCAGQHPCGKRAETPGPGADAEERVPSGRERSEDEQDRPD